MSEPMSSGEIEDVLSSIRRLVSEDLRPAPKAPSDKPNAVPEAGGKLLLTPALRIVTAQGGPRPAPAAAEPVAPPRVTPKPEPEPKTEDALEQGNEREFGFVAEDIAEDIVGGDDYDPEVDVDAELDEDEVERDAQTSDDELAVDEDEQLAVDEAELVESEDWLPEASVDDEAGPGWVNDPPEKRDASPDMTRVVSDIAAAVAGSDEEWEAETGDMPMSGVTWQAPEWVEEAELADDVAAAEDVIKDIADKAEEAAVAEIMERAAQAKAEAEARQNTGTAEKKAPEKASEQARESSAKPDIDEDIFAEDEGYFDETVLRDLVRDLIREELSGTLGERITRNVRKLVRAEINRALTARDFD
ncbi:MAG: hypothetical protein WBA92_15560 [Pseudorhodobacter sp.]